MQKNTEPTDICCQIQTQLLEVYVCNSDLPPLHLIASLSWAIFRLNLWSDSLELSIYTSYWIEKLSHMPLWWLRLAAVWDNICPHSKRRFRKCKLKGTVLQQFFGEFSWAELTNLTILFVDTLASWSLVPFADRWTRLHTLHLLLLWLL